MGSKILFKNTTIYTENIAYEAGEAFWNTQPAYKKRVKKYKTVSAVLVVTFLVCAVVSIFKSGPLFLIIGATAMAASAAFWFVKSESMIKNSAKRFHGLNTRVTYGVSENFFFVINRIFVDDSSEARLSAKDDETALLDQETNAGSTEDELYEDEFLPLEELLVCIVTENLYILVWPKPYYILERNSFEDGKDAEFKGFIEKYAKIVEA